MPRPDGGNTRDPPKKQGSPYWHHGFLFRSQVKTKRLRTFLETPSRFTLGRDRPKRGIIEDNLVELFQLLVHFMPVQNSGPRYWDILCEYFDGPCIGHDFMNIASIYRAARHDFIEEHEGSLPPNIESGLLCRLVDEYITKRDGRNVLHDGDHLEQAIEALRKSWSIVHDPALGLIGQYPDMASTSATKTATTSTNHDNLGHAYDYTAHPAPTQHEDAMDVDQDVGNAMQEEPRLTLQLRLRQPVHPVSPVDGAEPDIFRDECHKIAAALYASHARFQQLIDQPWFGRLPAAEQDRRRRILAGMLVHAHEFAREADEDVGSDNI